RRALSGGARRLRPARASLGATRVRIGVAPVRRPSRRAPAPGGPRPGHRGARRPWHRDERPLHPAAPPPVLPARARRASRRLPRGRGALRALHQPAPLSDAPPRGRRPRGRDAPRRVARSSAMTIRRLVDVVVASAALTVLAP